MKIDGNELAILQNDLDREGKKEEALKIKLEFLRQVRESGDHCPCKEACRHHGNCFECVTIHRGHRDHLPMCLWDMVNERLAALSHMTEGTLRAYTTAANKPVILYEACEALRFDETAIRIGMQGIVNVMTELAMLPPPVPTS